MWKADQQPADASLRPVRVDTAELPVPDLDLPQGVTALGRTLVVKGELRSDEHLIIEGRFEGRLSIPEHGLAIGAHASVSAEILARTVTILGSAAGTFTASECIALRPTATVEGLIIAPRVAIDEGALFNGRIDPKRTDAAVAVARHRLRKEG